MLEKTAIIDNLKINYLQSETVDLESPIIFLHGWQSKAIYFRTILDKCNNYIAIDLPGFSKSEKPKETWGVGDYADFLDAFILKLNIKNPILVGHSFGGSVIVKYCSEHKNVCKKIILISSAGIRERGVKIKLYNLVAKIFNLGLRLPFIKKYKEKIRRRLYKTIDSSDYVEAGEMKDVYRKIINEDLRKEMDEVEVNTILIWGENDEATPLKHGEIFNKKIKNSKFYTIHNAGHYCFIDNEKEFNEIFLKEIER